MCKYMLLQNNCINNSVTNGLKHKEEKKTCKTTLYDKIKDRREAGVNVTMVNLSAQKKHTLYVRIFLFIVGVINLALKKKIFQC